MKSELYLYRLNYVLLKCFCFLGKVVVHFPAAHEGHQTDTWDNRRKKL